MHWKQHIFRIEILEKIATEFGQYAQLGDLGSI